MPRLATHALSALALMLVLLSAPEPAAAQIKVHTSGNATVGTLSSNNSRLFVAGTTAYPAIDAAYTGASSSSDIIAVRGYSMPSAAHGIGGQFFGGNVGLAGYTVDYTSTTQMMGVVGGAYGRGQNYGVTGYAGGVDDSQVNIGVYGSAASAQSNAFAGYFSGDVYVTGSVTQFSDERLKTDITPVVAGDALASVMRLQPSRYVFRQDGKNAALHLPSGEHFGLMAQDVEAEFPSLVSERLHPLATDVRPSGEGADARVVIPANVETVSLKGVNYMEMIPLLVSAIQAQQAQIEAMRAALVAAGVPVPGRN